MLDILKMELQDVIVHFETYPTIKIISETYNNTRFYLISSDGLLICFSHYGGDNRYYSFVRDIDNGRSKNFYTNEKTFKIYNDIKVVECVEDDNGEASTRNIISQDYIDDVFLRLEKYVRKQKIEKLLS